MCCLVFLSEKKKAIMYLVEKITRVKLRPGMGCSAVGCEFNVNESMIYINVNYL